MTLGPYPEVQGTCRLNLHTTQRPVIITSVDVGSSLGFVQFYLDKKIMVIRFLPGMLSSANETAVSWSLAESDLHQTCIQVLHSAVLLGCRQNSPMYVYTLRRTGRISGPHDKSLNPQHVHALLLGHTLILLVQY